MENNSPKKRSKITKLFYVLVGHLSLGLGLVGIVLPLLPTTPFVLLAAACYMRGSVSLYNRLINHRLLGPYIMDYRGGKGIPMNVKITALVLIWITIPLSVFFLIQQYYVRLALMAIAFAVSVMIWRLPTIRQTSKETCHIDVGK